VLLRPFALSSFGADMLDMDEYRAVPRRTLLPVVITALVAAIALPLSVRVDSWTSGLVAELTIVLCAWALVRCCENGAQICQLIFWSFSLAWLGVAPLYQLTVGQVAWGDYEVLNRSSAVLSAQVLILLSLAAFFVGANVKGVVRRSCALNEKRVAKGSWLLAGCAFLMLPMVSQVSGGFMTLFASRQERSAAFASLGLVKLLPAGLATIGCYFAVILLRSEIRRRSIGDWRVARVSLAVLASVTLLIYCNPIANSRFIAFAAIGCCVISACQPRSRRSGLIAILFSLAGLLFAYPLAYGLRWAEATARTGGFSLQDWSGQDFDGFQQWVNTVLYVERNGNELGATILSALLFFVPRSMWADKEIPASITVAEFRRYSFTNLSLPISAELYLNFGIIGVVLAMLLLGRIWAGCDHAWLTAPQSLGGVMAPVIATQQLGLIRGPMGSLAPVIGTAVILTIGVHLFARART
jgi:hypothetical protein